VSGTGEVDLTGKMFPSGNHPPGERKEKTTLEIRVHDDNIEKAIKDLKRQLQKEGLFKEIKKRSFYEKPSVKDRRKRREAQKRRMKAQRRKSFYD
jgi:small subunit ribosomal protein S21